MEGEGSIAGLVEMALTFALALGIGVHQMLDLRRERRKREQKKRDEAA